MRLDLYGKKPSVSLMMLMRLVMDTFYSIDASVSSGRTGMALFRSVMPRSHADCITQHSSGNQVAQS